MVNEDVGTNFKAESIQNSLLFKKDNYYVNVMLLTEQT